MELEIKPLQDRFRTGVGVAAAQRRVGRLRTALVHAEAPFASQLSFRTACFAAAMIPHLKKAPFVARKAVTHPAKL